MFGPFVISVEFARRGDISVRSIVEEFNVVEFYLVPKFGGAINSMLSSFSRRCAMFLPL